MTTSLFHSMLTPFSTAEYLLTWIITSHTRDALPPPQCSCPAEIWQEFRNLVFKACMPLLAVVALCYQDEHTNTHGHLPVSHHATHPSRWSQRLSHKGVGADCGGPGFCRAYAIIRWSQHSWGLVMGGHHCVLTGVCWEVIYILLHARLEYHWPYCASFPLTTASWQKHRNTTHGNMVGKENKKWQIENGILNYGIHIANIMENMYFLTPCTLPWWLL